MGRTPVLFTLWPKCEQPVDVLFLPTRDLARMSKEGEKEKEKKQRKSRVLLGG